MQIRFGRHIANFLCLSMLGAALTACSLHSDGYHQTNTTKPMSSHYVDGTFRNSTPTQEMRFADSAKAMWRLITQKAPDSAPGSPLEIVPLTHDDLVKAPDHSLWRLGHSTVLIKLQGKFWLTDPVFSDRASPFAFGGFKRFHVPPIARENLP